jgi:hypothetical protein
MKLVEQIRKEYPNVISFHIESTTSEKNYCVLGAFNKYVNAKCGKSPERAFGYPVPYAMVERFIEVNPRLTEQMAEDYANVISELCDAEKYEEAWAKLAEALGDKSEVIIPIKESELCPQPSPPSLLKAKARKSKPKERPSVRSLSLKSESSFPYL